MTISVTPIPKLTAMAAPAFTLGTANAAGSAETAVASDSTLLAFDTTLPSAVGTAATGSAVVAVRRDHVHAGVTGSGTVVDEAITRFNGTGGSSLQGYSSLSPTISDAGIISLTSGALKFPATAIASTDANTLDEYQQGTFTPIVKDAGSGTGSYSRQVGWYTKIGQVVTIYGQLILNGLGSLTAANNASIGGLPYTARNETHLVHVIGFLGGTYAIAANTTVAGFVGANTDYIACQLWDSTAGLTNLTITELGGASGSCIFSGSYLAT